MFPEDAGMGFARPQEADASLRTQPALMGPRGRADRRHHRTDTGGCECYLAFAELDQLSHLVVFSLICVSSSPTRRANRTGFGTGNLQFDGFLPAPPPRYLEELSAAQGFAGIDAKRGHTQQCGERVDVFVRSTASMSRAVTSTRKAARARH